MRRSALVATLLAAAAHAGCYHYSFDQNPDLVEAVKAEQANGGREPSRFIVHERQVPTFLNGFVGTGTVNTDELCKDPIRTELRVTATDVLAAVGTLLIYTPHTLYVTCPREAVVGKNRPPPP